MKEEEMS